MADPLSPAARERFEAWRNGGFLPDWAIAALDELVAKDAWNELEDRFFRDLSFGTGGMRGRVIGRVCAMTELGTGGIKSPAHPAIGANTLNDVTVARATMGLFHSVKNSGAAKARPRLIIAHDVRHFSRHFAKLAARVWTGLGGEAWLFTGPRPRPRSTPQLSFSVRALGADTGIVLTASHNPPHDNGYKVYAAHGGQVVPPLADQIVEAVRAVKLSDVGAALRHADSQGECWETVPDELDKRYADVAAEVVLDAPLIRKQRPKIVYSALHGTGDVVIPQLLRGLGAEVVEVASQKEPDANFSTVKSPNPGDSDEKECRVMPAPDATAPEHEDGTALTAAYELGDKVNADAVLATDPDADRIGAAFRKSKTKREGLMGNELAILLAQYRLSRAKELGWLPKEGSKRTVLLKTFVTTPMLDVLARSHGVGCVNTLTGFKWMGAKLFKYEQQLLASLAAMGDQRKPAEIAALAPRERAALYLKHSSWMVFAAEESYGCLAGDLVRDKDANAAAAMCAELAAWLKSQKKTAVEMLHDLYAKLGLYKGQLNVLTNEGAAGVLKIQRALVSLRAVPPKSFGQIAIERIVDFQQEHHDEEGDVVPRENFLLYDLAEGWRCAVRASGTEPKLKIYGYAREDCQGLKPHNEQEETLAKKLDLWLDEVVGDIKTRADA